MSADEHSASRHLSPSQANHALSEPSGTTFGKSSMEVHASKIQLEQQERDGEPDHDGKLERSGDYIEEPSEQTARAMVARVVVVSLDANFVQQTRKALSDTAARIDVCAPDALDTSIHAASIEAASGNTASGNTASGNSGTHAYFLDARAFRVSADNTDSDSVYDDDRLLAEVSWLRSQDIAVAIRFPEISASMSADQQMKESLHEGVADLLFDMCNGLVARSHSDVASICKQLLRRSTAQKQMRFEYVTLAPDGLSVLCVLNGGHTAHCSRPLSDTDSGHPVVGIGLNDDASIADLHFEDGSSLSFSVHEAAAKTIGLKTNPDLEALPIDGPTLGLRLRTLRQAKGLTQAELARRTGIHRPNIARVEAGRHVPSLETIARLAAAIGVSTSAVLQTTTSSGDVAAVHES